MTEEVIFMIVLNFDVVKQRIIKKNTEYLVNHTLNFLEFHFSFDEQWDSFSPKYIIFKHNEKNYLNILTYDTELEKYTIKVPSIVLEGSSFRFTIYGLVYVGGSEVRITTQEVTIKLHDSGFTNDISNLSEDGDIDIFTRLFDSIGNKYDEITIENGNILCKSDNVVLQVLPLSTFLDDYYKKSETDHLFDNKADKIHNHVVVDVTDFENNVDCDLEIFLDSLTENIRII